MTTTFHPPARSHTATHYVLNVAPVEFEDAEVRIGVLHAAEAASSSPAAARRTEPPTSSAASRARGSRRSLSSPVPQMWATHSRLRG